MIESTVPRSTPLRLLADQAFSRTAGAPLVSGNAVRLLKDAAENYPAWLQAIAEAERSIFFESYIVADDEIGRGFRDALAAKARQGVRVYLLHDWLGSPGRVFGRFWGPLVAAGGSVRAFNPPRFDSPLGWLSRDHRKSICVDGRVAFVSGLCVSQAWCGVPARGRDAWRDTGIEIRGPAVADVEGAFATVWEEAGDPLPAEALTDPASIAAAGSVALRVVAGTPMTAGLMRLDQLIAAIARTRLWLTDAYFVPVSAYVHALSAAALDGVDVRLLVPGASDVPLVSPLSRAGYRQLLEAGVRIFEWNGTMLHAKTAVADGRWARVGSTNLNIASFIGNYELDVAVEDEGFAETMEREYERDLGQATEIVLHARRRTLRPVAARSRSQRVRRAPSGSAGRAAAGALRIGSAMRTAITRPRELGVTDGKVLSAAAVILLALVVVGLLWPKAMAWPLSAIALWFAIAFLIRAWRDFRDNRAARAKPSP
ncbi:MAG TPA: phospholipase D-like domain-containing protein [Candidatus Polarisedimenticolaceae bacterium]|nr:phospholipase D-like domain-containing protein [Candidatus Polarisedimenticolaceae bacterium]